MPELFERLEPSARARDGRSSSSPARLRRPTSGSSASRAFTARGRSSSSSRPDRGRTLFVPRGVAQPGRAPGLGPGGFVGSNPTTPTLVAERDSAESDPAPDPRLRRGRSRSASDFAAALRLRWGYRSPGADSGRRARRPDARCCRRRQPGRLDRPVPRLGERAPVVAARDDDGRLLAPGLPRRPRRPAPRPRATLGLRRPRATRGGSSSIATSRATSRTVLRRLYAARFPIRRMVPVDAYGASDFRSIEADNTSAFNCRHRRGHDPLVGARLRSGDRPEPDREPVRLLGRHDLASSEPAVSPARAVPSRDGRRRRRRRACLRRRRLELGRPLVGGEGLPALLRERAVSGRAPDCSMISDRHVGDALTARRPSDLRHGGVLEPRLDTAYEYLRCHPKSVQPVRTVESTVLLNRTEDVLNDPCRMHAQAACAVRKAIESLPCAMT